MSSLHLLLLTLSKVTPPYSLEKRKQLWYYSHHYLIGLTLSKNLIFTVSKVWAPSCPPSVIVDNLTSICVCCREVIQFLLLEHTESQKCLVSPDSPPSRRYTVNTVPWRNRLVEFSSCSFKLMCLFPRPTRHSHHENCSTGVDYSQSNRRLPNLCLTLFMYSPQ